MTSFNDLSATLRNLKDLPLEVTSMQGTSPVFRYSEPFPSLPNIHTKMKNMYATSENVTVFNSKLPSSNVPLYVAPITGNG